MPRILIALIQVLFLTSSIIATNGAMTVVRADTPLNSSNWLGTDGAHYWHIKEPGTYYLDIEQDIFCTTHNVAIFIQASDVILDGKGKTITGSGPPSVFSESGPDVYGVRANAGVPSSGVQVKNLNVEKKYYSVIFEAVSDGAIENVNASGNHTGIYLWDADNNTISGNTASNNLHTGIVLDAR
jgi:parallel beta-helix repeat protein